MTNQGVSPSQFSMNLREERLIEKVREKVFLYDKGHAWYVDTTRKSNAFAEIEVELELRAGEAKTMWDRLKKQYTQYLAKLKAPSGSGAKRTSRFRHADTMSFYRNFYRPHHSTSTLDDDEAEGEDDDQADEGSNDMDSEFQTPRETGASVVLETGIEVDYQGFENEEVPEVILHTSSTSSTPTVAKKRGMKRKAETPDITERLLTAIEETTKAAGDEYDHLGALLAGKIRKMSSKNLRYATEMQMEIHAVVSRYELKIADDQEQEQADNE